MSRTEKFFKNTVSVAMLQIVTVLCGLVTPRVMLMIYGSEVNGLISSITQFVSVFSLVEAGLSNASIYALYKPLAENDYDSINSVVTASKKFYEKTGYIFTFLIILMSGVYPLFIKTSILSYSEICTMVLVCGASGALDFFTLAKYRAILTADQRTYIISTATIIHLISNTVLVYILAHLGLSVVCVKLITLSSYVLRSAMLMLYCKRKYRYLNFKVTPNKQALNKRWDAMYLQVLGVAHRQAPVIILTLLVGDLQLISVYSVFNMIVGGMNSLLGIFKSGLAASFGEIIARREQKTLQQAYGEFEFSFYTISTVVYSIAAVMIIPFISIYTHGVSDINYCQSTIGFLIVLDGLLYNIKTPQGMLIMSAGMYKETRMQTTIQGSIAIVLGIILAPRYGVEGVLTASIISNIYRDIDLLLFVPKYITKISARRSILRAVMCIIVFAIIITCSSFIKFSTGNYMQWIIVSIIVGIVSVAIVLLFGLLFEKKELISILKRLRMLIKRKAT